MSNTTLVLNADANPVSVVPLSTVHWQDAVRIIYLGRATVLSEYNKWVIRSPSIQMRMPSVIMLKAFQKHNGKVEFSRYNVILRDKYICQYCHNKFDFSDLTFDHVVPSRDGGKTNWDNIVSACSPCNQVKAHHRHMKPLNNPYRPTYWELANNRKKIPIVVPHQSWKDFISWESEIEINERLRKTNFDGDDSELNKLYKFK